jgi:hypothetical protein
MAFRLVLPSFIINVSDVRRRTSLDARTIRDRTQAPFGSLNIKN